MGLWNGIANGIGRKKSGINWSSYWTTQFTEAAGITDATQIAALKTFVGDLLAINTSEPGFIDFETPSSGKIKAIYPFIGGAEASHKFNLVDPRDDDAAFRLEFTQNGGSKADYYESAANVAANTNLIPADVFTGDCQIIEYIIEGTGINGVRDNGKYFDITTKNTADNKFYGNVKVTGDNVVANALDDAACFSVKRQAGNVKTYINGALFKSEAKDVGTLPSLVAYIGAINLSGSIIYNTSKYATIIYCDAIDDASEILIYNAIHKFNKNLSREISISDIVTTFTTFNDGVATYSVTNSKHTITEAGDYNGLEYTSPVIGAAYDECWIRDFYYTALGGYITDAEILNVYNWYKSHITIIGDYAYWVPDHIGADGTVYYNPGNIPNATKHAPIDGNAYMALLAALYYNNTSSEAFILAELSFLNDLLINSIYADDLVSITAGSLVVSWGFYDAIRIEGKSAFLNVLYYDAFKQMNDICLLLSETGYDFGDYADNIKSLWLSTFWDGTKVKASTGLCSGQFDVNAAAYSIYSGLVEGGYATNIANAIRSNLPDIEYSGYYQFVPTNFYYDITHVWEGYISVVTFGEYQNGGYWTIALPWILNAIKLVDSDKADYLLRKSLTFYMYYNKHSEWRNASTNGVDYYCANAGQIKKALDIF